MQSGSCHYEKRRWGKRLLAGFQLLLGWTSSPLGRGGLALTLRKAEGNRPAMPLPAGVGGIMRMNAEVCGNYAVILKCGKTRTAYFQPGAEESQKKVPKKSRAHPTPEGENYRPSSSFPETSEQPSFPSPPGSTGSVGWIHGLGGGAKASERARPAVVEDGWGGGRGLSWWGKK